MVVGVDSVVCSRGAFRKDAGFGERVILSDRHVGAVNTLTRYAMDCTIEYVRMEVNYG
jgi:hypothetical protein